MLLQKNGKQVEVPDAAAPYLKKMGYEEVVAEKADLPNSVKKMMEKIQKEKSDNATDKEGSVKPKIGRPKKDANSE